MYYVHTNYKNTLYYKQERDTVAFSTSPLDNGNWRNVPFTTLQAYKNGQLLYVGTCHQHEYIDNPADTHFLYLDYIGL